jgi:single-strand DNA-binding protein
MMKMILNGSVGNDAEVKQVGSRTAINFSIAVSMDYKDSEGKKVEKTEWVRAVIWKSEQQNTAISDYLKKGKRILVEGVPSSESYKGKDGELHSQLHINVKDIEFLN